MEDMGGAEHFLAVDNPPQNRTRHSKTLNLQKVPEVKRRIFNPYGKQTVIISLFI